MGSMIPLDASRRPRSFPTGTISIIVANVLVFYTAHVDGFIFGVITARMFENLGCSAESRT